MVSGRPVLVELVGDPWDQQPGETSRAYEAFRAFRDLGPARTLAATPGGKRGTIGDWSSRMRWHERARAWDAEGYRLEDARRLDQIRQMDENHLLIANAMIGAGLRTLQAEPDLTPHQAARLLDIGTRLQRAALTGERLPTAEADSSMGVDEDLSPLERIARELAGTA